MGEIIWRNDVVRHGYLCPGCDMVVRRPDGRTNILVSNHGAVCCGKCERNVGTMKEVKPMLCEYCGNIFKPLYDDPAGVTLKFSDGSDMTLCRECINSPDIAQILRTVRDKKTGGNKDAE